MGRMMDARAIHVPIYEDLKLKPSRQPGLGVNTGATLTPALLIEEGEGAVSIPSPPEGEGAVSIPSPPEGEGAVSIPSPPAGEGAVSIPSPPEGGEGQGEGAHRTRNTGS